MASSLTPETSEIKRRGRQRLVGAVAIVLLAVVFVPMMLDPEPRRERTEPSLAIPPRDTAPPLAAAKPAPKIEPAAPVDAPAAAPAPAAVPATNAAAPAPDSPPVAAPKPAVAALKPPVTAIADPVKAVPTPKAPPAPKFEAPPKVAEAKAPTRLEGFAVQVGAFREEEKLRQARVKLAAAKVPHYIERLPSGLTRLRAGPFGTREAAERSNAAVTAAGLAGQVVTLP